MITEDIKNTEEQTIGEVLERVTDLIQENVQKYIINLGGSYVADIVLSDMLPDGTDEDLINQAVLKYAFRVINNEIPNIHGLYEDILPEEIELMLETAPFLDWLAILENHLSSYIQTYYDGE